MLDPFRRPAKRSVARAKVRDAQDAQFDPVALSLAIWLGIVVAATGFSRVLQDALDQARAAQAAASLSGHATSPTQPAPVAGVLQGAFMAVPLGG